MSLNRGTLWNLNKDRSSRKPSALTVNKLQMMQDLLDGNILFHIILKYSKHDL